jgi:hypothetical protein
LSNKEKNAERTGSFRVFLTRIGGKIAKNRPFISAEYRFLEAVDTRWVFKEDSYEKIVTLLIFQKCGQSGAIHSGRRVGRKNGDIYPYRLCARNGQFFVKSGKKALEKLGLKVDELELTTASAEEIAETLRCNDIIYITGGNTFFLLQELRRTGADLLGRVDNPVQRPSFGKWSTSLREKWLKYGRIPANFSLVLRKICAKSDPFPSCQHALVSERIATGKP